MTEVKIQKIIGQLGALYPDSPSYESFLKESAKQFQLADIMDLPRYFFGREIPEPKEIAENYQQLGAWLSIRQNIIFDLFLEIGPQSIPTLETIAFGPYDWTQYKAIEVLCRFAAQGIETEKIIDRILLHLSGFRYEAKMPALRSLSQIKENSKVISAVEQELQEELKEEEDISDVLYLLNGLYECSPVTAQKYIPLLHQYMVTDYSQRNPVLDGAVLCENADGTITYSWTGEKPPSEHHNIEAAMLAILLNEKDKQARELIKIWIKEHPEEKVRSALTVFLQQHP